MNKKIYIISIVAIGLVVATILISTNSLQSQNRPHISYNTKYGAISISTTFPETPDNFPIYKVVERPNDTVFFSVIHIEKDRTNVTPESEAPSTAKKILDQYGGLPNDSQMSLDKTQYLEEHSGTGQIIAKYPISTSVQFVRIINGHQIAGDGGYISIELGTDGELLYFDKVWRTVIPNGSVHVISASEALRNMQRGEILGSQSRCGCELTVNKITLTYREDGRNVPQKYLDPVWVFSGTLEDGSPWNYQAYAWNSSEVQ